MYCLTFFTGFEENFFQRSFAAWVYHIIHCHWTKINCGSGLGLEIPVMYQARGHEKALQWLEKVINKIQAADLASKFKD